MIFQPGPFCTSDVSSSLILCRCISVVARAERRSGRNDNQLPKKWAKTSRRQDSHESKKVRGQAPGQEEAGGHTKEMRANEEEVKWVRMGVAMDGCSLTAEDHPPPTVSRGGGGGGGGLYAFFLYIFFLDARAKESTRSTPPTRFLPHRHEAVSVLRGQGGAVCNPARGRDPLSPPPPPRPPSACRVPRPGPVRSGDDRTSERER